MNASTTTWTEKDIAERFGSKCPICERNTKAWRAFMQATRTEPMTYLGYDSYCPDCMLGFQPETVQELLDA